MIRWHTTFSLCTLMAALCSPQLARSQATSLERRMDAVVKLRIHRLPQTADETAAGLFVGKDYKFAYFITAFHAVTQTEGDHPVAAPSVRLQFHNSTLVFKAVVFDNFDAALDLAVVQIPVGDLPTGLPEIVRSDVTVGISVVVIGHPTSGDWSVTPGTVQRLNTSTGDIHHFITTRNLSLAEGDSGGPVFDLQGAFLGMHTETDSTYGIETKSIDIVSQLTAWHVPTNNFATAAAEAKKTAESKQPPSDVGTGEGPVSVDLDKINRLKLDYKTGFQNKNILLLRHVWPSITDKRVKDYDDIFRAAESIKWNLNDCGSPAFHGDTATFRCVQDIEIRPRGGDMQHKINTVTFYLQKEGSDWTIARIDTQKIK
jgi:S1-C subfamily serine protease